MVSHFGQWKKADAAKSVIEASLQVDTRLLALLATADVWGRTCMTR
jgi:hypothetical protein